ncbi:MAG: beta-ketoacyl synthase N-terminal-like domain-containing protein [Gemmatimonadales bacterium]|nr:beta-ketoacyl synthase N-terminal-like domain-containing protein [Gemmatimonadales bacterium]
MKPLAITGLGTVSPVALEHEGFLAALRDPEAARARAFGGPCAALPADKLPGAKAAEVRGFDANALLGDKGHRNFDKLTKYLIVAARQALESAGLKRGGQFVSSLGPDQIGICSSTAYGSLDSITELNLVAELEDPRYINPARFPNTVINAAAGYVSIWEDLRAPNVTIVDGNCGALDAVLTCETHLAHRRADAFLVGGGDVLSEPLYVALQKLGALAKNDDEWAPGQAESAGLHLGEGAAYLCVERLRGAEARGATLRALVAGYGTAFESPTEGAFLLNASPVAVARAIRLALDDAGIAPSSVDAVCASCSGLSKWDVAELYAIEQVLGPDIAVAAPKAMWGESFAGAGALGMAAAVSWIEGITPAPLLSGRPSERTDVVVVTTVGYYGNVSAVVLKRP